MKLFHLYFDILFSSYTLLVFNMLSVYTKYKSILYILSDVECKMRRFIFDQDSFILDFGNTFLKIKMYIF